MEPWNPVAGFSILTVGCMHCYATGMSRLLEAMGVEKCVGLGRRSGRRTAWNGIVKAEVESGASLGAAR